MIPRYTRPDMASIWSDEARFKIWLEVELLALEKMAEEGTVPKQSYLTVKEKAKFDPKRVLEIENEVKHDVIAFLTNLSESVGPDSRFVHRGMTSNDLLDTTFALQLKRSGEKILGELDGVLNAIKERAIEFKHTPCIGRSHGIHAEPITFGLKLASWYAELSRSRGRLESAVAEVAVGKIAGAVGTYASITPTVEAHVMKSLGLTAETVSTQIVSRDRHASFFQGLALIGSSIERFCVEIRHLQRSEVMEAAEPFGKGQKGSSAMPHKRNPILCENISGLARLLRSYAQSALENVPLWHERDISHSSVERVIAPDACCLTDFMLARFKAIVAGLDVYPDQMKRNLDSSKGVIFSGSLLLALVDAGVTREDAYRLVQTHALQTWEDRSSHAPDFRARVEKDPQITKVLNKATISQVFDLKRHLKYVDLIFDRTFKGN